MTSPKKIRWPVKTHAAKDIQIKATARLHLDVLLVFTATNPERYTARGQNHYALKDRIGAEIRALPSTPKKA